MARVLPQLFLIKRLKQLSPGASGLLGARAPFTLPTADPVTAKMSEPGTLRLPELGLSAEEAADRFGRLQQKLVPLWRYIRAYNQHKQTHRRCSLAV